MELDGLMDYGADPDGPYRYRLWRRWDTGACVLFCLLNPSTAAARTNDPTIRKCMALARTWGYGGLEVVNLFAYRSTDPRVLERLGASAIGPRNDAAILDAARESGLVVVGWGNRGPMLGRDDAVLELLEAARDGDVYCLGKTKAGEPKHPLYLPHTVRPVQVR